MNIHHFKSLYRVCVSFFILILSRSIINNLNESRNVFDDFYLIQTGFGKFNAVFSIWLGMQIIVIKFYFAFSLWINLKCKITSKKMSKIFTTLSKFLIGIFIITFTIVVCVITVRWKLPVASSMIVTIEMTRFLMKIYAFARSVWPEITYKNKNVPHFSTYLYFLFAPVLVFKEFYPRSKETNWNNVLKSVFEVLCCIICLNFAFDMCIIQKWKDFGKSSEFSDLQYKLFCHCSFLCINITVIFFYLLLHSWLNGWAEILKFADRQFYTDWWNQKGYKSYYKSWNVVVQDWLYFYVYRDIHRTTGSRTISQISVFIISGVFHELCISISLGFIYPLLFFIFVILGYLFTHVEKYMGSNVGNIFLISNLIVGSGTLWTAYTIEFFARQNCPRVIENKMLDLFVPRSWYCY